MIVVPMEIGFITQVEELMGTGAPYIRVRSRSDYWMYARLFSLTCPVAVVDGIVAGAVIAFRSQDAPDEIYVQDVTTHPEFRGKGVARRLLADVKRYGVSHGCRRVYLTSEPDNSAAHHAWIGFGFVNLPGDRTEHGVFVTADFKGPGQDRAVYELDLRT